MFELILQIVVLLGAIALGIRLGGMAIGYAGGIGVALLCLGLNMAPGDIPWDVILIIMSVIAAISAMQLAGGLDYLVYLAEKVLRKNPKYVNYLSPIVTYLLTLLAGTGHTAFSMIPVIVEVSKEQNIKPSVPLSIAVVASQVAITASPVSAAVIFMSGALEPFGWSYPTLILIWIATTFSGCMITAFIVSKISPLDLSKDKVYQQRLKDGLIKKEAIHKKTISKQAKLSVFIFIAGIFCIVFYATTISDVIRKPMLNFVNEIIHKDIKEGLSDLQKNALLKLENQDESKKAILDSIVSMQTIVDESREEKSIGMQRISAFSDEKIKLQNIFTQLDFKDLEASLGDLNLEKYNSYNATLVNLAKFVRSYIDPVRLPRDGAIISLMLAIAVLITIFCKIDSSRLADMSTFKSGMTACICVLGVAWLGNTFVQGHQSGFSDFASALVGKYPWTLAIALFFTSTLLYSQTATVKAIIPVIIVALNINANPQISSILVASFAAASALFVLPTYPTLIGAIQMDDTGTTRIGKFLFNHSFIIPGILSIAISVVLCFMLVSII